MTVAAQRMDGEVEVCTCKALTVHEKWGNIPWRLTDKWKDTHVDCKATTKKQ